jgi:outer membrane protein OmpA-like peptidoglycan-associated protein
MNHSCLFPAIVFAFTLLLINTVPASDKPESSAWNVRLETFTGRLDSAVKACEPYGPVGDVSFVIDTRVRLNAAKAHLEDYPSDKLAKRIVATCSLFVEAARMELALRVANNFRARLQDSLALRLNDLNKVYEIILRLEQSQAGRVKADLEARRQQATKLKTEAEKRFKELQSNLILVRKKNRFLIISLKGALFVRRKPDFKSELETSLAKIAGILTVFKDSYIIVEGRVQGDDPSREVQVLSAARAETVMKFLVDQGVAEDRIKAAGCIVTGASAKDQKGDIRIHQRVDLVIQ